jgi:hypothetical protein
VILTAAINNNATLRTPEIEFGYHTDIRPETIACPDFAQNKIAVINLPVK